MSLTSELQEMKQRLNTLERAQRETEDKRMDVSAQLQEAMVTLHNARVHKFAHPTHEGIQAFKGAEKAVHDLSEQEVEKMADVNALAEGIHSLKAEIAIKTEEWETAKKQYLGKTLPSLIPKARVKAAKALAELVALTNLTPELGGVVYTLPENLAEDLPRKPETAEAYESAYTAQAQKVLGGFDA